MYGYLSHKLRLGCLNSLYRVLRIIANVFGLSVVVIMSKCVGHIIKIIFIRACDDSEI